MDRIAFMKSVNFEFLRPGNELLANLAGLAEAVRRQIRNAWIRKTQGFVSSWPPLKAAFEI